MTSKTYWRWLVGLYVLGVVIIVTPLALFMMSALYTGTLPLGSPDEGHYLVRMQAHILHPFTWAPDGVWFTPDSPPWLQVSLIEFIAGSLFSWMGLNALQVSWLMLLFLAPLAAPLTALLARRCGASAAFSLLAGFGFFVLMQCLSRLFHPSVSYPLTALAMLTMWAWWEKPSRARAMIAGTLAGLLVGVYMWSWTFTWAAWGLLGVILCTLPRSAERTQRWRTLPFAAGFAVLFALPALLLNLTTSRHPLFTEVADRMGLLLSRELESPMRSVVILVMTALLLFCARRLPLREKFAPLLAMTVAILVVYNQQLVHGKIISFSSHYLIYFCLVSLLALVFALTQGRRKLPFILLGLTACVPLAAAVHDWDGASIFKGWVRGNGIAHLTPALEALAKDPSETVLTDWRTGDLVGATTNDGVAFIAYARILLIPTEEYVERYCLSESFTTQEIDTRWVAVFQQELSRAARSHTQALFDRHLRMAEETCPRVKADIPGMLRKYHVTRVLWNEVLKPDWKMDPSLFTLVERGEGWSLWKVNRAR